MLPLPRAQSLGTLVFGRFNFSGTSKVGTTLVWHTDALAVASFAAKTKAIITRYTIRRASSP